MDESANVMIGERLVGSVSNDSCALAWCNIPIEAIYYQQHWYWVCPERSVVEDEVEGFQANRRAHRSVRQSSEGTSHGMKLQGNLLPKPWT